MEMTSGEGARRDAEERLPEDAPGRSERLGGRAAERLREQLKRVFGKVPPGTPLDAAGCEDKDGDPGRAG
jgi:hypothetical protein